MISLRIPPDLERRLNALAIAEGKSRSEIIKESISEYISRHSAGISPYDLGKDLFGKAASGTGDLSTNRKEYLKQILHTKHEKRHLPN